MAVAPKTTLGTQVSVSSGTTLVITTTAAIAIDDLVVVRWSSDNLNATTPTATCADSGGNSYTAHVQRAVNATAAAGVSGGILCSKATVAVALGGTITVTLSGAVVSKSASAESFTGVNNTTRSTPVSASGASTTYSSGNSGAASIGDLMLGCCGAETRATSTAPSNSGWVGALMLPSAGSGSDAARTLLISYYKINTTGAGEAFGTMTGTNTDWVAMVLVLQAAPEPSITQASYRWYDETGTESGSTALAAQDTAATGNLSVGDGYGHLRIRLQATTAVAVPASDDFQLQWEKNASGSWTNVQPPAAGALLDTYASSNQNANSSMYSGGGVQDATSQSFVGDNKYVTRAGFYMIKTGSPTFDVFAYLYNTTGGGTGTQPTGSPIATSVAVNSSTFTTSFAWYYFDFVSPVLVTAGTNYAIAVGVPAGGDASNYITAGIDNTSPTHTGARNTRVVATWSTSTSDLCFEVYTGVPAIGVGPFDSTNLTDGQATTNRLGAGTGSFVAGKVSEDGLVDNLGWSASNYTEILYSLTLKAADLVNGDTIRLRVLRNGATTNMTYTVTPTVNIVQVFNYNETGRSITIAATAEATFQTDFKQLALAVSVTATPTVLDTKPFTPSDVTGLVGWYDADLTSSFTFSSGAVVSQWSDKSASGRHWTQATTSLQPVRTGEQKTRTTVVFDGVDDYMQTASFTLAQPMTLFMVGDAIADTVDDQTQGLIASIGGEFQVYSILGSNTVRLYSNGTELVSSGTYAPGEHLWRFVANGASSTMHRDGASVASGTIGTNGTTTGMYLGADRSLTAGTRFHGEMCEVIVYNRVLTAPEITNVETFLSGRWLAGTAYGDTGRPISIAATVTCTDVPGTALAPITQEGFRWRNDDGTQVTATWKAAQDTNTTLALDTPVRLRVLVDTSVNPAPFAPKLYYKKTTDSTWLPVPVGAGGGGGGYSHAWTGTDPVAQVDTANYTLGTYFSLGSPITVQGIRIWNPGLVTVSGRIATLWTHDGFGGSAVLQRTIDIPDLLPTGWSEHLFSSSYAATTGVSYCVAYFVHGVGSNADYGAVNGFPLVVGAVHFDRTAYSVTSTPSTCPIEDSVDPFYGVDILHGTGGGDPNPVYIATSANITASGEATTAQLTPPSGKTTADFAVGRMWDDENGTDSVNI